MSTTDERIAVLERQVAALTAQLSAREQESTTPSAPPDGGTTTPSRRRFLRYAAAGAGATAGAVLTSADPAAANDPNDITMGEFKSTSGGPTVVSNTGSDADSAKFVFRSGTGGAPEFPRAALGAWATLNGASKHGLYAFSERGSAVRAVGTTVETAVIAQNLGQGDAVFARAENGVAVYAVSKATAGRFAGDRAAVNLYSFTFDPNESHDTGDLHCASGTLQCCVAGGVPGTWRILASSNTAGSLHPLFVPARVYDSRTPAPAPGKLTAGQNRTIDISARRNLTTGAVTEANVVPVGATAIVLNLTISETEGFGYLAVNPGGQTNVTASTINWTEGGQTLANGGLGRLNTDRKVTVVAGGGAGSRAHFVIDVVGYYM